MTMGVLVIMIMSVLVAVPVVVVVLMFVVMGTDSHRVFARQSASAIFTH